MIEIEKGIPIPPPRPGRRNHYQGPRYPFNDLEVGDSFFVPIAEGNFSDSNRLHHAIRLWRERNPAKSHHRLTMRTVEGGIRVWRVA